MHELQDSRDTYNRIYASYLSGHPTHDVSLANLSKARRRVRQVCHAFGIPLGRKPARVLDVGCGLGVFTKALELTGASVTGIDIADTAIEIARKSFPTSRFVRAAFPADVDQSSTFNLIWAVDLSLINTFDIASINQGFIRPALARLEPGGAIVIGWHTDFSGERIGNWANWSRDHFRLLRSVCGLSRPRVVQVPGVSLGILLMRLCERLRKSAPIFFVRRKNANINSQLIS